MKKSNLIFFVVATILITTIVSAATTINTNISTGGQLSVTGTTTLMGNVGIGTTTPAEKLEVVGKILSNNKRVRTAPSTERWVIFGDSMSNSLTADYPNVVIDELGLNNSVTHAVSGNTIGQQVTVLEGLLNSDSDYLDNFSILTLLIGVNDFAANNVLGGRDDASTTSSYAGLLKKFLELALTSNPNIRIYLLTPMEANGAGVNYQAVNSAGWTIRQLGVLISQIGSDYGVQVIDLYSLSQFNRKTIPTYTSDGLHPNSTGQTVIGHIIAEAFSSPLVGGRSIDLSGTVVVGSGIGIGSSSPYSLLSISNSRNTMANTPLLAIASTSNGTATSTIFTVAANGNTGLGTTTPYAKLSVADGGTAAEVTLALNNRFRFGGDGIMKWGSGANHGILSWDTNLAIVSSAVGSALDFRINGVSTSRLRIDLSGNVGIGTSSPATRLHISNGASATTTVTIGELGLNTSKGCVNMNRADGGAGSFYLNAAGLLISEPNYCK